MWNAFLAASVRVCMFPTRTSGFSVLFAALISVVLVQMLPAERVPGRYIVELTTVPAADYAAAAKIGSSAQRSAAISSHREAIRSQQASVRAGLEQQQARVLGSVDTVANAMFVEAPDDDPTVLASIPGVRRVIPVRRFRMILDRAVFLTKAAEAWNRMGAENAGRGMKIAIIDTGIESDHAAFQDASLQVPDGFPKVNRESDRAHTTNKVIVARSYVHLLPNRDPDASARDRVGHGTALATIAAGVRNAGPRATISGIAPGAYLGSYKVFGTPGFNDYASDDAILKAIDDAVADGMDVINLSLGDDLAPRLEDDIDVQAVERASKAGVIVVIAAGNNGPSFNTMSSPATAPSAIAVGSTTNDRTFAASVEVGGLAQFLAVTGSGSRDATPITSSFADVSPLDGNGLACTPFSGRILEGKIALILRGGCFFEDKLNNAQSAGAVAAIVYAAADSPEPFEMGVGDATLPAQMVSHENGLAIKQGISAQSPLVGTLRFAVEAVSIAANRVSSFSSAGPSVDAGIKPDLMAPGSDIYTATQTFDASGDMYSSSGFVLVDGTSFSAPAVAGAAALVKALRPGLTVEQYRSLLINTATAAQTPTGDGASIQKAGAGILDVLAATEAVAAASPASLSFGVGGPDTNLSRTLSITNLGGAAETFTLAAMPRGDGPAPSFSSSTFEVAAGATIQIPVSFTATGLSPKAYEGVLSITGTTSGRQLRVPYWYDSTGEPASVTILSTSEGGRRGSPQRNAILFRITDEAGVALTSVQPEVTVVSGGGSVQEVNSYDSEIPGLYGVTLQLGPQPGLNVFRIQTGRASVEVTIAGS